MMNLIYYWSYFLLYMCQHPKIVKWITNTKLLKLSDMSHNKLTIKRENWVGLGGTLNRKGRMMILPINPQEKSKPWIDKKRKRTPKLKWRKSQLSAKLHYVPLLQKHCGVWQNDDDLKSHFLTNLLMTLPQFK